MREMWSNGCARSVLLAAVKDETFLPYILYISPVQLIVCALVNMALPRTGGGYRVKDVQVIDAVYLTTMDEILVP